MAKKHDFVLDFGPFGANLPPIFFTLLQTIIVFNFKKNLKYLNI